MNPPEISRCPYRGLVPFSEQDAARFFGRDAEIRVVSSNLMAARLTLLYGDSGVGKSSLLHAGVVPHLKRVAEAGLRRQGRPRFQVVTVERWQDDPLAEIDRRLAQTAAAKGIGPPPGREPGRFVEHLAAWTDRLGGPLLFVFDQFEEYLRYHEGDADETSFAAEFPRAVSDPELKANFLVAIREDEYARLDRFKPRMPGLYRNYLRLRYLGLAAARDAILRPLDDPELRRAGATLPHRVEPELVDAILNDVRAGQVVLGEAGIGKAQLPDERVGIQTPYLQLVLTRVWEAEAGLHSGLMRLATYQELGGADRIVRSHLDTALSSLSLAEQGMAADVFRHLVTPSGAKVAHSLGDLADYTRVPSDRLRPVLDHLGGALRILRPVAPAPTQPGAPRFEIYTDSLAKPVLDWGTRFRRTRERAEAEAKLAEERRRKLVFIRLSAGLGLALLIAATLGTIAWLKWREATVNALVSRATLRLADDPQESASLMLRAAGLAWLQPAATKLAAEQLLRESLLAAHRRPTTDLPPMDLVPANDAQWSSPDGRMRFRRLPDETSVLGLERSRPDATAPDAAERFDSQLGAEVLAAEFSATGSHVAFCGADAASVWKLSELTNRTPLRLSHPGTLVRAAAFSGDASFLVTVSDDGAYRVWNLADGTLRGSSRQKLGRLHDVAISPDDRFLATAGEEQPARIWEIASGSEVTVMRGYSETVRWLQFAGNGEALWTADTSGRGGFWATRVGQIVARAPDANEIVTAKPTRPGVVLVTTDPRAQTGGVSIGDGSPTNGARQVLPVIFGISEAAISDDGVWVALAGRSNRVQVWNLVEPGRPPVGLPTSGGVIALALSRDAETLAALDDGGEVRVWRWKSSAAPLTFKLSRAQDGYLSFDASGRQLVAASGNDPVVLAVDTNAASGGVITNRLVAKRPSPGTAIVKYLAISRDQTRVLAVDGRGEGWIWRLADGRPEGPFVRSDSGSGAFLSAAISPRGRFLLIGGEAGAASVWDTQQPNAALYHLPGHSDSRQGDVVAVWFSDDGLRAFTAGRDGTIRRHDVPELVSYSELIALGRARLGSGTGDAPAPNALPAGTEPGSPP